MDLSAGYLLEIGARTDRVFEALHLKTLLLRLPLRARDASTTIKGICRKVRKNRSLARSIKAQQADAQSLPTSCPSEPSRGAHADEMEQSLRELEAFLSNPRSVGFVLVLAEVPGAEMIDPEADPDEVKYCPVAGGVVEVYDACERTVRAVWCRRSIPGELSLILTRALLLRLLAHAFASAPNNPPTHLTREALAARSSHAASLGVLACCKASTMALFPLEALEYCRSELRMTRHWETAMDGGQHSDQAANVCRCRALQTEEGAWEFSGISLSRFVSYWRNHGKGSVPQPRPFFETFFRRASDVIRGARDGPPKSADASETSSEKSPRALSGEGAAHLSFSGKHKDEETSKISASTEKFSRRTARNGKAVVPDSNLKRRRRS